MSCVDWAGQTWTEWHPKPGWECVSQTGGPVWRTEEEAGAFIQATELPWVPKVYGLELQGTWETDVSSDPHPSDDVQRLLVDAGLFQL